MGPTIVGKLAEGNLRKQTLAAESLGEGEQRLEPT
jgi:hypothetical protein